MNQLLVTRLFFRAKTRVRYITFSHVCVCVSYNTPKDNWIDGWWGAPQLEYCSYFFASAPLHRLYRPYQNIESHPDKQDIENKVENTTRESNESFSYADDCCTKDLYSSSSQKARKWRRVLLMRLWVGGGTSQVHSSRHRTFDQYVCSLDMNGGTQERAERRELSLAGYVICSSASIQHRLLFSISPSTTFYKAKTRHFPSGILCEGKKRTDRLTLSKGSFYSLPIQFHPIQLLTTAGIFCPCFKHWTRQLPAKKLHFLFDSRILSHFFLSLYFFFPFLYKKCSQSVLNAFVVFTTNAI